MRRYTHPHPQIFQLPLPYFSIATKAKSQRYVAIERGTQISLLPSHWGGGGIYNYASIGTKKRLVSNCNAQCILKFSRILQSTLSM